MQRGQALGVLCALFVTANMCGHGPSQASCQESTFLSMKVIPGGTLIDLWQVTKAEFAEGAVGVQARLDVRNISASKVPEARFYAEYYDSDQRRCFTAMFSLSENLERQMGGMAPGETRTLVALTDGLFPASKPETVRVYPMPEDGHASHSAVAPAPAVYRPVRIAAASRHATDTWQRLCLSQAVDAGSPAVLDLLLAEAEIDALGPATGISVLRARAPQIQTWFRVFAPHLGFFPAAEGPSRRGSRTLILVRGVLPSMHPGLFVPPPRTSRWIVDYIKSLEGDDVPWINVILLERPVEEPTTPDVTLLPTMAPLCLDYGGTGTEWSLNSANPE